MIYFWRYILLCATLGVTLHEVTTSCTKAPAHTHLSTKNNDGLLGHKDLYFCRTFSKDDTSYCPKHRIHYTREISGLLLSLMTRHFGDVVLPRRVPVCGPECPLRKREETQGTKREEAWLVDRRRLFMKDDGTRSSVKDLCGLSKVKTFLNDA